MPSHKENTADEPGQALDFELPRHGVIREDNWAEYKARGFQPLWNTDQTSPNSDDFAQSLYGIAHVFTGDAYDDEAGKPLRHKPGIGIYVNPDGLRFYAEQERKEEERRRQRDAGGT